LFLRKLLPNLQNLKRVLINPIFIINFTKKLKHSNIKKSFIALVLLSGILSLSSCKGKTDEATSEAATTTEATTTETADPAGEPKSYAVTIAPGTPEIILLGKNKEASVKILNLKAIDLSDPDGKSLGMQLSYQLELTNKNPIGGSSIQIDPNTFRLELDNGNKISHDDYISVSADAESTKTTSEDCIFKLPAGTKPTALNLFHDETRVSVKLQIK
jgi:hypothetical protein